MLYFNTMNMNLSKPNDLKLEYFCAWEVVQRVEAYALHTGILI